MHRNLRKMTYIFIILFDQLNINYTKISRHPPHLAMANTAYEIERILDEEIIDDKPHYLIKWKGYSSVEATWEPIENLIDTLDLVHQWKVKNGAYTTRPKQLIDEGKQDKELQKTKKISGKDHDRMEKEFQAKLNLQSTRKRKVKCLSSDQQQERLSLDQESESNQKDMETNEYSFGQDNVLRKTRSKTPQKSQSKQNSSSSNYTPNNTSTLTRNKVVSKHIKNSQSSPYSQSMSQSKQSAQEQLSGFKVVGKVTKQGIETILWCFDWEDEKICEVQLKDGRKVNMKREDVKKICPGKLLEYYEKIQKARI